MKYFSLELAVFDAVKIVDVLSPLIGIVKVPNVKQDIEADGDQEKNEWRNQRQDGYSRILADFLLSLLLRLLRHDCRNGWNNGESMKRPRGCTTTSR